MSGRRRPWKRGVALLAHDTLKVHASEPHAAGLWPPALAGSERVRRQPCRRARSAPACGVSRGPRAYRVRVPVDYSAASCTGATVSISAMAWSSARYSPRCCVIQRTMRALGADDQSTSGHIPRRERPMPALRSVRPVHLPIAPNRRPRTFIVGLGVRPNPTSGNQNQVGTLPHHRKKGRETCFQNGQQTTSSKGYPGFCDAHGRGAGRWTWADASRREYGDALDRCQRTNGWGICHDEGGGAAIFYAVGGLCQARAGTTKRSSLSSP